MSVKDWKHLPIWGRGGTAPDGWPWGTIWYRDGRDTKFKRGYYYRNVGTPMEHGRYVQGPFKTLKEAIADLEQWAEERRR